MGNKSKQRVGARVGLSWKSVRDLEPLKFMHPPNFALAPKRVSFEGKVVDPKTKRQYPNPEKK